MWNRSQKKFQKRSSNSKFSNGYVDLILDSRHVFMKDKAYKEDLY